MDDKEKRQRYYRAAANHIVGVLVHRERRRLGWCFVNYVRTTFPENANNFAGFRYTNMGFTNDDESTESGGLREQKVKKHTSTKWLRERFNFGKIEIRIYLRS